MGPMMPRDARPSDGCTSDSCRNSRAGRGLADLVVILTFKILSIFTLKIQSIFTLKILSIFTLKILSIFTEAAMFQMTILITMITVSIPYWPKMLLVIDRWRWSLT